jgi:hypothetical protein
VQVAVCIRRAVVQRERLLRAARARVATRARRGPPAAAAAAVRAERLKQPDSRRCQQSPHHNCWPCRRAGTRPTLHPARTHPRVASCEALIHALRRPVALDLGLTHHAVGAHAEVGHGRGHGGGVGPATRCAACRMTAHTGRQGRVSAWCGAPGAAACLLRMAATPTHVQDTHTHTRARARAHRDLCRCCHNTPQGWRPHKPRTCALLLAAAAAALLLLLGLCGGEQARLPAGRGQHEPGRAQLQQLPAAACPHALRTRAHSTQEALSRGCYGWHPSAHGNLPVECACCCQSQDTQASRARLPAASTPAKRDSLAPLPPVAAATTLAAAQLLPIGCACVAALFPRCPMGGAVTTSTWPPAPAVVGPARPRQQRRHTPHTNECGGGARSTG